LRGVAYFWRFTPHTNARARQMFEKAIALDPQYAEAYAWLGWTYHAERNFGWSADSQTREREVALAQQALTLDDSLAGAHSLLSFGYAEKQQYDEALAEGNRAIALDPNDATIYAKQAQVLNLADRPQEALQAIEKAMRLNPHYPPLTLLELGWAYRLLGRYEEAIAALRGAVVGNPDYLLPHLHLAMIYSELRRDKEAQAEGVEILRISPMLSLAEARSKLPFKDLAEADRYLAVLRKAGLK
jgi:adenylate cyclase